MEARVSADRGLSVSFAKLPGFCCIGIFNLLWYGVCYWVTVSALTSIFRYYLTHSSCPFNCSFANANFSLKHLFRYAMSTSSLFCFLLESVEALFPKQIPSPNGWNYPYYIKDIVDDNLPKMVYHFP